MPKAIKWALAIVVGLIVFIFVAVLIAPMVINFDNYKPRIEAEASKAIGRPVTLGGKIEPSVFPWIGVALHDVHLGNPPGYEPEDFVSVGLFEVRVKLWPLLFGNYQVKTFVVKEPSIVLIKKKDGRANWEGLGGKTAAGPKGPEPTPQGRPQPEGEPPIKGLAIGQFAITNGNVLFLDHATGARHELKNMQLILTDVSLDQPIQVDLSAVADNYPLQLAGKIGPVGPEPGKSPVDVDMRAELLNQVKIQLQGRIDTPAASPQAAMSMQIEPFSLRKVMAELQQPLPFETADKDTLTRIALAMKISGTPDKVTVSDGLLTLDQTKMTFAAQAEEFDKPKLKLEAALDRIDVDRYLPPPSEKKPDGRPPAPDKAPAPEKKAPEKTDYAPLRKLVLDAQFKVNEMKAKNARMQNILLKAAAKNGIIRLDPMNIDLYQGRMSVVSTINVQQDTPRSEAGVSISKVQAGPMLKDVMKKEFIEGVLTAAISMQAIGDQPEQIRRTLNGKGELNFNEGAIVGIDLAGMVRNVQSAFGLAEKPTQKPRTDFSELQVPFSITDGLARLENARLQSPLMRIVADGSANLVQETLDIRVEPKFVATLKGQGDIKERAGIMVPVMVTGSFEDPKFRPDLKAILNQELPDKEALKKMIPPKEQLNKDLEKKAQDLLKGLPFGQPKKE